MDLPNVLLDAGLCVMVVCVLILGRALWTGLRASGQELLLRRRDNGLRLDLYLGLVWSGMLLVQVGNILLHTDSGGLHNVSSLALLGTASTIFVCGACAGRLLLRLEMRRHKKTHRDLSGVPGRS